MLNTNILNINPEIVSYIILKAKEFQAKEGAVTFTDELPNTEYEADWSQILADHDDDLTFEEVDKMIEDLEPDQQIDLLTLMYVGRGDYDVEQWSEARKEASRNLAPHLGQYLLTKPQIADYLERALEALGYTSSTDID